MEEQKKVSIIKKGEEKLQEKEREVEEALSKISQLHRRLAREAKNLDEEIAILKKEIKEMLPNKEKPEVAKQILPRLCLLSELCGAIDFSEMIKARKLFQQIYPDYFPNFLKQIDKKEWELKWPGCLECSHFSFSCSLSLSPREVMKEGRWEMECPSLEKGHR